MCYVCCPLQLYSVIFLVKNILKSTNASSGTFIVIRVSLARLVSLILPRRRIQSLPPPLEKILYATLMLLYVVILYQLCS